MIRRYASAVVVALAALAGCLAADAGAPIEESASTADLEVGRRLATLECGTCHAPGGAGESRNPQAPPLRTLAERYPGALLAEAFPQRMKVGHPAMPEFRLSPSEVDALLLYLLSIQERRGA